MRKFRVRKIWSLLIALAMVLGIWGGIAVPETRAADQPGSMGRVPYEHRRDTTKWVTYDGAQKPVYCIQPTRSPSSDGWNANYRYRWNLSANAWLLDNNKRSLENNTYAIDSGEMQKLAKILYVGYGHNATGLGNGVSEVDFYKATQDAVFYIICYGKDNAPSYAGKSYRKRLAGQIVEAAKNVTLPSNYTLYMYIPDSESAGNLQNTVNLEVSSPSQTPSTTPTPTPAPAPKTVPVTFRTQKFMQGRELKDSEFAFVFESTDLNMSKTKHTRVNDKDGNVDFGQVTFMGVGTYQFEVREYTTPDEASSVNTTNHPSYPGIEEGVTYDKSKYSLKIKVEESNGSLVAKIVEPSNLYRVEKTENGVEKIVALKDGDDISGKTIQVGKFVNSIRSMKTTVSAGGKTASENAPVSLTAEEAAGVNTVTDKVAYSGLTVGSTYSVEGKLLEVKDGAFVNENEPVATATVEKTADATSGTWDITFNSVTLEPGKQYVVWEKATNQDDTSDVLEHKDATDNAQAITVGPKFRTTVTADGTDATANQAVKKDTEETTITIPVQDKIAYEGLDPSEIFTVNWEVWNVTDNKSVKTGSEANLTPESTGSGTWTINIGDVELEAGDANTGKIYVIYETATGSKGTELSHKDNDDKAQMIVVNREQPVLTPELATTVSAGGQSGSADQEVKLTADEAKSVTTVVDTITYKGLTAGTEYTVEGKLQEIENGTVKSTVATATEKKTPTAQSGTWDITFSEVTLEPGKTYVVYESATPAGGSAITHEKPGDKAQTIVVEKEILPEIKNTTINAGGKQGSDDAAAQVKLVSGAEVEIIDNVELTNVKEGTYTLKWELYDKANTSSPKNSGTQSVSAVRDGDLTTEVNLGTVNAAGTYTIKMELLGTDDVSYSVHNGDFSVTRETVTVTQRENVGKLATTVSSGENAASSTAALTFDVEAGKTTVTKPVTDTITYEGMEGGSTYLVIATLNEVADGKVVKAVKTVQQELKADASGKGTWQVNFGDVALEMGKTYVVFEYAENVDDSDDNADHKNVNDLAQTVVVNGPNVVKKVNGGDAYALESEDEEIEFTITATVPDGVDSFAITDALPAPLVYVEDSLAVTLGGKDALNYDTEQKAAASAGGSSIRVDILNKTTESSSGPSTIKPETAYGKEVVVTFKCRIDEGADLSAYAEAITNIAVLNVNDQEYTSPTDGTAIIELPLTGGPLEGSISTTVSAGGKTATSKRAATLTAAQAAKVTTVTDTIKAESLTPDSSYKVTGKLMKVTNGKAKSTGITATQTFKTDENGDGTWKMTFRKVKLAAGTKYVVFETAVNTEDESDTYEHADVNDKAQTIVVGAARASASTKKSKSVKTGDESQVLLWSLILAGAAAATVIAVRRRRSR